MVIKSCLVFESKALNLPCYCRQHHITVNCVVSFEENVLLSVGFLSSVIEILTTLYYIDVRFTGTTPVQLNVISLNRFYNIVIYSKCLMVKGCGPKLFVSFL